MSATARENRLLRQEIAAALDRNADCERIIAGLAGVMGGMGGQLGGVR